VADNSAGTSIGCFNVLGASALTIDDSDVVNCRADGGHGGMASVGGAGTTVTILNSRITGSSAATEGSVARVSGGVLRIAGSTVTDSADGSFAVYDSSGIDFSVQVLVLIITTAGLLRAMCS